MAMTLPSMAQTTREEFVEKYNLMVSKLGPSGVGIETLLDRWEEAFPNDVDAKVNRFLYHYNKAQSIQMIAKQGRTTYLGRKPALTLKDSLGTDVNYFEDIIFDDDQFSQSIQVIDKIIATYPDRLDFRFSRISALLAYEKESPDMATTDLLNLIDYNATKHPTWNYPGVTVNKDFWDAAVQEYAYNLFRTASPVSYEAFRLVSERMLKYDKNNTLFMDNMGSYYMVAKRDNKKALKYYEKVLKLKPDDITAIKNCIIMARTSKDTKLEKKYLPLMVKYGQTDADKTSAQMRLDYLNGKK